MVKVEDLRQRLVQLGLTEAEAENIKGKANLLMMVGELEADVDSKEMLNGAEEVDDGQSWENIPTSSIENKETDEPTEDRPPLMTDPEWTDYVLSHLKEDEKIKGHPKADSLRRLTELLIGTVVEMETEVRQTPGMDNGYGAAVVVHVTVDTGAMGMSYRMGGAADVSTHNTDKLYAQFPVATAETRAEGRAFRKILRLRNVVAAEELSETKPQDTNEKIKASQITVIDNLASKADVNVKAFLKEEDIEVKKIEDIPTDDAALLCLELNKYVRIGTPDGIKGYKAGWQL